MSVYQEPFWWVQAFRADIFQNIIIDLNIPNSSITTQWNLTDLNFVLHRQTLDLKQMVAMAWDIIWQLTLLNPSSEHTLQVKDHVSTLKFATAEKFCCKLRFSLHLKTTVVLLIKTLSARENNWFVKSAGTSLTRQCRAFCSPKWLILNCVPHLLQKRLDWKQLYQLAFCLQWSRSMVKMCLITWRKRSSGLASSSHIIFTETVSTQEHRISSQSVPSRMKRVGVLKCF